MKVSGKQKVINASEIGNYIYCRRSWWYAMRGIPSESQRSLAEGTVTHQKIGRQIRQAKLVRRVLIALLILLIAALLIYILQGAAR